MSEFNYIPFLVRKWALKGYTYTSCLFDKPAVEYLREQGYDEEQSSLILSARCPRDLPILLELYKKFNVLPKYRSGWRVCYALNGAATVEVDSYGDYEYLDSNSYWDGKEANPDHVLWKPGQRPMTESGHVVMGNLKMSEVARQAGAKDFAELVTPYEDFRLAVVQATLMSHAEQGWRNVPFTYRTTSGEEKTANLSLPTTPFLCLTVEDKVSLTDNCSVITTAKYHGTPVPGEHADRAKAALWVNAIKSVSDSEDSLVYELRRAYKRDDILFTPIR